MQYSGLQRKYGEFGIGKKLSVTKCMTGGWVEGNAIDASSSQSLMYGKPYKGVENNEEVMRRSIREMPIPKSKDRIIG